MKISASRKKKNLKNCWNCYSTLVSNWDGNQDCLKNTTGNEFMLQIGGGKKRDENKLRISQHKVWLMEQQRYFSIGSGQTPMKWFDNGLKMSYFYE